MGYHRGPLGPIGFAMRAGCKKAFDGIRTRDLSLTKRVLCQLSYDGISMVIVRVKIHLPGIEPGTSRV